MESFESEEIKTHVKIEEPEDLKEIKEEILESDLPIDNGNEEIEYLGFGDAASFGKILNLYLEKHH